MSDEQGAKPSINNWTLVLPVGALTLLGGLMLSVSNEAAVSLKLSEQHGASILLLREEVRLLRLEMKDDTRDRYTSSDAARDLAYIQRDITELKETVRVEHNGK